MSRYICEHCDTKQSHKADSWLYCNHCGRTNGMIKYNAFIKDLVKRHGPALAKELERENKTTNQAM